MSYIALHAALISCTTPSSLAHSRGRSIPLPRLASWRSGCTRRAVDRFEMSQLQSSARPHYNLPQTVLDKNCVGNGSARGNLGSLDMSVSAARLPSFVLGKPEVSILNSGALPSFCGGPFRPSFDTLFARRSRPVAWCPSFVCVSMLAGHLPRSLASFAAPAEPGL